MQGPPKATAPVAGFGVGGGGLSWASERFDWHWPPAVIYFVLFISVVSIIWSTVMTIRWGIGWFRTELQAPDSLLRKCVVATRRKLIPLMLSAMGIAGVVLVAAAIAGAVAYSDSPPIDKSAPTTAEPAAATSAPTKGAATKLAKNYFPPEKIELGGLLSNVADQLNRKGLAAFNFANSMHAQPTQTKAQIDDFIIRTDAARTLLTEMSSDLGSNIISKNPRYSTELTEVVGWSAGYGNPPVDRFLQNLTTFRKNLSAFQQRFDQMSEPDRVWISEMIAGEARAFREDAVISFRKWIQDCSDRIDAKRDLLR